MLRKSCAVLVALVCMSGGMTGCTPQTGPQTRSVVDASEAVVEIPETVETAVMLWASGGQLMVSLGLGEYLVGVHPGVKTPWALEIYPRLTDVQEFGPEVSAETLLSINPDVVFLTDANTARDLRSKGVRALAFSHFSMESFRTNVRLLGEIFGDDARVKTDDYLGYLDSTIKDIESALTSANPPRHSVYYIDGYTKTSLYETAGAHTINSETAALAMTHFVTDDLLEAPSTQVNPEAVLATNPDFVLIGRCANTGLIEKVYSTPEWSQINAVTHHRVYAVPGGISAWDRYGTEIALMIAWIANTVYPEAYPVDFEAKTIDFYGRFPGYTLSPTQAGYILKGLDPHGG